MSLGDFERGGWDYTGLLHPGYYLGWSLGLDLDMVCLDGWRHHVAARWDLIIDTRTQNISVSLSRKKFLELVFENLFGGF